MKPTNTARRLTLSLVLALLVTPAGTALAGVTRLERVSISSTGLQGNRPFPSALIASRVEPQRVAISADGRFIAFDSVADNLDPTDTNRGQLRYGADVFVRDRSAGKTERVSLFATDGQVPRDSYDPSMSADGRFVAFVSASSITSEQIFVRDRVARTTTLVADGISPAISADGRFVAFMRFSSQFVDGTERYSSDVYVWERSTGATEIVSRSSTGERGNSFSSFSAISADGRFAVFVSLADNLAPGDTPNTADVFVRDRQSGTTELVTLSSSGARTGGLIGFYSRPAISADGRFILFSSEAADLVPGDTNLSEDLFLRDRRAGTTERISVSSGGAQANGRSTAASMSADGRFIAFASDAVNLTPYTFRVLLGHAFSQSDIYVRDRLRGVTERISRAANGSQSNDTSYNPVISADGGHVAFRSFADNLVPGDTNGEPDVFVADRVDETTTYRIAVFRPSSRQWILRGADGSATLIPFGGPGDRPVPAEYLFTGGSAQIAVFRPATAEWFVRADAAVTVGPLPFGRPGDLPVPADYLGLRHPQIAVFRPSTREWLIRHDAGSAVGPISFGGPGDMPVPADYLGIGRALLAVFRPATREWFLRNDAGSTLGPIAFGGPGDLPVPADYLGERRARIAVYRPATAEWFLRDTAGDTTRISFGQPGDVPVPNDYLGTGHAQIAVYRPGTGEWLIRADDGTTVRVVWGAPGDQPVPGAYDALVAPG